MPSMRSRRIPRARRHRPHHTRRRRTQLLHLLAAIHGWSDESWPRERDAAIAAYLGPEHETAAKQGHAVLTAEVDRWTLRLSRQRTLERA
jgi:hypothetical protein